MWRQVGFDILQLGVKRKRPLVPDGDHTHHPVTAQADQVGVFIVEFVHQGLLRIARVLRNFLYKGLVVEHVNLLKFPFLRCYFKNMERLQTTPLHGYIHRGDAGLAVNSCAKLGIFCAC